jgi:putative effector of murein hydrolase
MTATVAAYMAGLAISRRSSSPFANPVLIAVTLLCVLITVTHTPPDLYLESTKPLTFLLGPATVALALPLMRELQTIRRNWIPVCGAVISGGGVSIATSGLLARAAGLPSELNASIAPHSVTAPVAVLLADADGGLATVTMTCVLVTGLIGSFCLSFMSKRFASNNDKAAGFSAGVSAHALGIARAMEISPTAAAFASTGMIANAIVTSLLLGLF